MAFSPSTRINTLPVEIIREFFLFSVEAQFSKPECVNGPMVGTGVQRRLSHVCRLWRTVALDSCELWATFHVRIHPGSKTRMFREWLLRSGKHPLSLNILFFSLTREDRCKDPYIDFLEAMAKSPGADRQLRSALHLDGGYDEEGPLDFDVLTSHASRWKTLYVQVTSPSSAEMLDLSRTGPPLLESLAVLETFNAVWDREPRWEKGLTWVERSPRLTEVTLRAFERGTVFSIPLPCAQLTTLTLEDLGPSDRVYLTPYEVLPILARCHNLKTLKVCSDRDSPWHRAMTRPGSSRLSLPSLTTLWMILSDVPVLLERVMYEIDTPNLQSVKIQGHGRVICDLKDLIHASNCSLRSLSITAPKFTDEYEVLELLRELSHLEELYIGGEEDDDTCPITLPIVRALTDKSCCPRLRSISLGVDPKVVQLGEVQDMVERRKFKDVKVLALFPGGIKMRVRF